MAWTTTLTHTTGSALSRRYRFNGQQIKGQIDYVRKGLLQRFCARWRNPSTGQTGEKNAFPCLASAQYWVEEQELQQRPRSA